MSKSFASYLKKYDPHIYKLIKKLMYTTKRSFAEVIEGDCGLPKRYTMRLKARDTFLITQLDLEEIISNIDGGERILKEICSLTCDPKEKTTLLKYHLSNYYPYTYVEAVLGTYEEANIIPAVNAGVIEVRNSLNNSGYGHILTPKLKELAKMLYKNKARKNKTQRKIQEMYREELGRCINRILNSKIDDDAVGIINKIEEDIKKWIKKL